MAEPEEILLRSLQSSGIRLPSEVLSVGDSESVVLISICTQSLNLLGDTASFPTSLPESSFVADQVKVCARARGKRHHSLKRHPKQKFQNIKK